MQEERGGQQSTDEDRLVRARRKEVALPPPDVEPLRGLALSGGGIRSATFCFGLVRGLAGKGVFSRFDYMSTVSGGGYLGSAIGRLYDQHHKGKAVEEAIKGNGTMLLWWLRNNGRYLTPAGMRDVMQAFASIVRGILSTNFEVGVLLFLGAAVMVLPTLALRTWVGGNWADVVRRQDGSIWLVAVGVPLVLAFHNIFAYWFVRRQGTGGSRVMNFIVGVLCAGAGAFWARSQVTGDWAETSAFSWTAVFSAWACLLLFTPLTGSLCRMLRGTPDISAARLLHTKREGIWFAVAAGVAAVGVLEWLSWLTSQVVGQQHPWSAWIAALPAPLVVVARIVLPYIKKWLDAQKGKAQDPVKTRVALNVAGIALLILVALAWATAFQSLLVRVQWNWLGDLLHLSGRGNALLWCQWLVLTGLPLAYVVATRGDLEVLNLSSMHNFYRARIERAYVSCGNQNRFKGGALATANRDTISQARRLIDADPSDDIQLGAYAPHKYGGPIHLVNCCINQTVDDRTGNYNADRKGVALTISSLGTETGTQMPHGPYPVPGTLSSWISISGAAASTGMGSETSPGLAALLFLSGARLGYWHESLLPKGKPVSCVTRPGLIRDEALARFPGLRSNRWYLSDGGHFDNTGVYTLLKRKVDLIVLADCGADPQYRFVDVENLVRKAQIDYGAEIEFITPDPALATTPELTALQARIGTPATITTRTGGEFLLLGRITYDNNAKGALVVVKPRCVPEVMLDIAGYAQRNATFPQESTANQFFDEEQWEAYHDLGHLLAGELSEANLKALRAWV